MEFALTAPLWGLLAFAVLFVTGWFTVRQFLDANIYHLARAQLYGNDLASCSPSKHWQAFEWTGGQMEFICPRPGKARGTIRYRLPWGKEVSMKSSIDLLQGSFERPRQPTLQTQRF